MMENVPVSVTVASPKVTSGEVLVAVIAAPGVQVPVTVVQVGPCVVVQRKSAKPDGYEAVQLGFAEQKEARLSNAEQGHFKKAGAGARKILREVRVDERA